MEQQRGLKSGEPAHISLTLGVPILFLFPCSNGHLRQHQGPARRFCTDSWDVRASGHTVKGADLPLGVLEPPCSLCPGFRKAVVS